MSKKVNWAEVDIRIRDRRTDWTNNELEALEKDLGKMKDVADNAEPIEIPQPALASAEDEDEAAESDEEKAN
jgi:hypothetical protein